MKKLFLMAGLLGALSINHVQAQQQQLPPLVNVSGVGEVRVQPTEVVVSLGVETREKTLEAERGRIGEFEEQASRLRRQMAAMRTRAGDLADELLQLPLDELGRERIQLQAETKRLSSQLSSASASAQIESTMAASLGLEARSRTKLRSIFRLSIGKRLR